VRPAGTSSVCPSTPPCVTTRRMPSVGLHEGSLCFVTDPVDGLMRGTDADQVRGQATGAPAAVRSGEPGRANGTAAVTLAAPPEARRRALSLRSLEVPLERYGRPLRSWASRGTAPDHARAACVVRALSRLVRIRATRLREAPAPADRDKPKSSCHLTAESGSDAGTTRVFGGPPAGRSPIRHRPATARDALRGRPGFGGARTPDAMTRARPADACVPPS